MKRRIVRFDEIYVTRGFAWFPKFTQDRFEVWLESIWYVYWGAERMSTFASQDAAHLEAQNLRKVARRDKMR